MAAIWGDVDRRTAGHFGHNDEMATKVMVVEDDHDVRLLLRLLLEDEGYLVVEASTGPQAVERSSGRIRAARALRSGRDLPLTRTEYNLPCFMAENPNRLLARDSLLVNVWGYDHAGDDRLPRAVGDRWNPSRAADTDQRRRLHRDRCAVASGQCVLLRAGTARRADSDSGHVGGDAGRRRDDHHRTWCRRGVVRERTRHQTPRRGRRRARAISRGDLHTGLSVADRDLTPLTTAFNDMAAALESRIVRETRFTSDVSHELRTPLMAISAAVEMARRSGSPERARLAFDVISARVDHLRRLVLDLLEISRFDAGAVELELTPTDVGELVREVVKDLGVDSEVIDVELGDDPVFSIGVASSARCRI